MKQHVRKPDWLKIKIGTNLRYTETKKIVENHCLHTICSSGRCPNLGECWGRGTATFMIAGDICTRSCKFCNTQTGKPLALDENEPDNLAKSISLMKLEHAVVTSVDRDDLDDLGAKALMGSAKQSFAKKEINGIPGLNFDIAAIEHAMGGKHGDTTKKINAIMKEFLAIVQAKGGLKKLISIIIISLGFLTLVAQNDYYIKQAQSYQREAEYYTKQALGYEREVDYYNRQAQGYLREAEYYSKRGAFDFLVKPWDNDKLISTLTAARDKARKAKGREVSVLPRSR